MILFTTLYSYIHLTDFLPANIFRAFGNLIITWLKINNFNKNILLKKRNNFASEHLQ